jgi:DNA polymerase-3 subunit gamma/tau
MRALTRAWQILFKGNEETGRAGNALQAAEMTLIRLAYAADLPSPDEVISKLSGQVLANAPMSPPAPRGLPPNGGGGGGGGGGATALRVETPMAVVAQADPVPVTRPQAIASAQPQAVAQPALATVATYKDLIALATAKRDVLVKLALESQMRPVSFEQGRIEVALADGADPGMIATLAARLQTWTGQRWLVMVSTKPPEGMTIRQEREQRKEQATAAAHEDPLVKAILETFPGAKLVNVSVKDEEAAATEIAPAPIEEDDE